MIEPVTLPCSSTHTNTHTQKKSIHVTWKVILKCSKYYAQCNKAVLRQHWSSRIIIIPHWQLKKKKKKKRKRTKPDQIKQNNGRGRNSSVGSAWARCPQRRGLDLPLGTFSGRGDFYLGVNMGSNSIPPKTPSDESINRGLVCAHMHLIAWTQKVLTFMS